MLFFTCFIFTQNTSLVMFSNGHKRPQTGQRKQTAGQLERRSEEKLFIFTVVSVYTSLKCYIPVYSHLTYLFPLQQVIPWQIEWKQLSFIFLFYGDMRYMLTQGQCTQRPVLENAKHQCLVSYPFNHLFTVHTVIY